MAKSEPCFILWRTKGGHTIHSILGDCSLALARDHDGNMSRHVAAGRNAAGNVFRPYGVTAWRYYETDEWQPMSSCPIPEDASGPIPQKSKYGR